MHHDDDVIRYARDSIIMQRLAEVSLVKEAHKPVGTFSGGMKAQHHSFDSQQSPHFRIGFIVLVVLSFFK